MFVSSFETFVKRELLKIVEEFQQFEEVNGHSKHMERSVMLYQVLTVVAVFQICE